MSWNDECQYCRSNCNGGCNGVYTSAIENAIKPYKDFKDTWKPLIDKLNEVTSDPYFKVTEGYFKEILTVYNGIRNKAREEILATLSTEVKEKLKELGARI